MISASVLLPLILLIGPGPDGILPWQQFTVPLSNGTTATAFVMPASNSQDYLILCKPGTPPKVVIYQITPNSGPIPPPVPPGPDPPNPDPPVPPVKQSMAVVVIEETTARPQSLARLLASPTFFGFLNTNHHSWRLLDKDVVDENGRVPADLAPWLKLAEGKTLPYLVLAVRRTDRFEKVFDGALPHTEQGVIELIKKHGGG